MHCIRVAFCCRHKCSVILSHVFYMAIYIVERTEFLMEFMLFRYHKIRKEIFIFLTFPISNVFSRVILSCVCVSWGVFCAIKRNCIILYCIVAIIAGIIYLEKYSLIEIIDLFFILSNWLVSTRLREIDSSAMHTNTYCKVLPRESKIFEYTEPGSGLMGKLHKNLTMLIVTAYRLICHAVFDNINKP